MWGYKRDWRCYISPFKIYNCLRIFWFPLFFFFCLCKTCSLTTVKLCEKFKICLPKKTGTELHLKLQHHKELKAEQIERGKKYTLSIRNLPSQNSSWNKQYYCYRECFKLRCGWAQSTQSTEARQRSSCPYVHNKAKQQCHSHIPTEASHHLHRWHHRTISCLVMTELATTASFSLGVEWCWGTDTYLD